jgi:two-component system, OmpR family, alkaline phosphatase synthesis response regulator PhoP
MRANLLLVDDEEALLMTLGDRLRNEGYDVDCATDGDRAFEKAKAHSYDLVILDIMLPRRSGLVICREIRQAGLRTPVLILSAKGRNEDKSAASEAGADDYVTKPFDMVDLVARVRTLLEKQPNGLAERAGSPPKLGG